MDLKTMLIQWALLFLTNATDGKTEVDCSTNRELNRRGVTAITCAVTLSKGHLAIGITFQPTETY